MVSGAGPKKELSAAEKRKEMLKADLARNLAGQKKEAGEENKGGEAPKAED